RRGRWQGSRPVKRASWTGPLIALALVAGLVAACRRPADEAHAPAAAPIVERPGPVRWNATAAAFELNGKPLKTSKVWTFDGSTEGFTGVNSKITPAPGQGLAVVMVDPTIRSPKGLNVP